MKEEAYYHFQDINDYFLISAQVNQQAAIIKQQTEVIKSLISNNADLKNELEQIKALVSAVEEYQSPRP